MKSLLLLLPFLLLAQLADAEDIRTKDGKLHRNVTVTSVAPDGISVTTSAGIEHLPFTQLPPELQQKYGYDPAKAAAYANALHRQDVQQEAAANRARAQMVADEIAANESLDQSSRTKGSAEKKAQAEAEKKARAEREHSPSPSPSAGGG